MKTKNHGLFRSSFLDTHQLYRTHLAFLCPSTKDTSNLLIRRKITVIRATCSSQFHNSVPVKTLWWSSTKMKNHLAPMNPTLQVNLRLEAQANTALMEGKSHVICTMILTGIIVSEGSSHVKRRLLEIFVSLLMHASAAMAISR